YKQMEEVKISLQEALQDHQPPVAVRTWQEVSPGLAQGIAVDNVSGKFTVFLLLLVVAFGIMNTFLMSAFERVREFGVLMSIGVRPRTCAGTLMVESQMLMAVGFIIGFILGASLSLYFGTYGLTIAGAEEIYAEYGMSNVIYPALTLPLIIKTFIQVWLVTFLVALYPAWKITRFRPVEALRHI
ncbi:MAG: ABC transporter permease, partial [Alphaproteobacteria bacterium]